MTIFLIGVFVLCICSTRLITDKESRNILSKDFTKQVNGIMTLLIFASHFTQYVEMGGE